MTTTNDSFSFAYYEPIKNRIYLTAQFQGDAINQLYFAHNGKVYSDMWYFTEKYNKTGLFYFLGRV